MGGARATGPGPDPLPLLQESWQSFSRLQHSEQIAPAWKGQFATSGRSKSVVHTVQVSRAAEGRPSAASSGSSRSSTRAM